jgi:hypothetical protein
MSLSMMLGMVAACAYVLSFSVRNETHFRLVNMTGSLLWAGYYGLLGAHVGMVMLLIGATRQVVSIAVLSKPASLKLKLAFFFGAVLSVALAFAWQGPRSFLPWLALMNATYSYLCLSGLRLRKQLFFGNMAWLPYDLLVGAWAHMAMELVALVVNGRLIRRLEREAMAAQAAADVKQPAGGAAVLARSAT